jgi:hypothetical protein
MEFLLVIIIFVMCVKFYEVIMGKINESFDNNCIANITPRVHVGVPNLFEKDKNGNIMIDENGDALYNTDIISDSEWKSMVKTRLQDTIVNDMESFLKNPMNENYPYFDERSCNSYSYLSSV